MQAWQHGTPMLASSGYVSQVDAGRCIGCSTCVESCRFGALSLVRDPSKGEPEIHELMAQVAGRTE